MRLRAVLFTLLLTSGVAHADLVTRALDESTTGGAPPAASVDNNLLSCAGPVRQTSLPDLLQVAVRLSPALQTAKLDIEIAEAQIQQTWSRRDWLLTAEAQGSWSGSGLVAGVAVGSSKRFATTVDITRMIPTGGTIGLHAGTAYSKTESAAFNSEFWTDDVGVVLTQPLLRGAGSFVYNAAGIPLARGPS